MATRKTLIETVNMTVARFIDTSIIVTGDHGDVLGSRAHIYQMYLNSCDSTNRPDKLVGIPARTLLRTVNDTMARHGIQTGNSKNSGFDFRGALLLTDPLAKLATPIIYRNFPAGHDPFEVWLTSYVTITSVKHHRVPLNPIYNAYFSFCCATRQKAMGRVTFAKRIEALGARRISITGQPLYDNVVVSFGGSHDHSCD